MAKRVELLRLRQRHFFADVKSVWRRLFDYELVRPHGDLRFRFGGTLELVAGLGDFLLRETFFNGLDHAAHGVELVEIIEGPLLHVESHAFDKVRAAEGINSLSHS